MHSRNCHLSSISAISNCDIRQWLHNLITRLSVVCEYQLGRESQTLTGHTKKCEQKLPHHNFFVKF